MTDHELQSKWDTKILWGWRRGSGVAFTWMKFLQDAGIEVDAKTEELCAQAETLRAAGLVRVPRAKNIKDWGFIFWKIKFGSLLSRGSPGALDQLSAAKTDEESLAIISTLRFKRLIKQKPNARRQRTYKKKHNAKARLQATTDGTSSFVKARELDKRHDWKTVK